MERAQILKYNRQAWNEQVRRGNRWTVPVIESDIEKARSGTPSIVLTPNKRVPHEWFPTLNGCPTLMLASGGGQQSPIMAAAGANVTVVDLSDDQLKQDRAVAEREGLSFETIQASMDDLGCLQDESFELVVHPCSNSFVPELEPVWREVARVTRKGGRLLTGFCNPLIYLFDENNLHQGNLVVRHSLPYSDLESLSVAEREKLQADSEPLMWGHTLTQQIGQQLAAGFAMRAFYEDVWGSGDSSGFELLDKYTPSFIATYCERL